MTREALKCANPTCLKEPKFRGLCDTCYSYLRKEVKAGRTTWKELEAKGAAIPPKRVPSTAKDWLRGILRKKPK